MECACGGNTGDQKTASNKLLEARLTFQVCKECGRVSGEQLHIKDGMVLSDTSARLAYNTLDHRSAASLYETILKPAVNHTAGNVSTVEVGETASLF